MKLFFLGVSMLIAASAYSEVPTVTASEVTCQELKDMVTNYKTVNVKYPFLRWIKTIPVNAEASCRAREIETAHVFRTKDVRRCVVGAYCAPDIVIREPHCIPTPHGCF